MKKKEAANEKLMYEIAQENKRLTEPLAKALKEVEGLRRDLTNYEKVITFICTIISLIMDLIVYFFYFFSNISIKHVFLFHF